MKFLIITHAEHKVKQDTIYAYKPYVKEMNIWLKHVYEVEIVAPISNEEISVIDSRYHLLNRHSERSEAISSNKQITSSHTLRNDKTNRHSVLDAEFYASETSDELLKQVQHDEALRHSERSEAISSSKQIATSHTPRNDEHKRHLALDARSHDLNGIRLTQIPSFDITSLKKSVKALLVIPKILWNIFKAMQRADHIHVRCPGNIGLLGALVQILFPSKPKTVKYAGNWDPKSKQPISYRFQKWILSNTFLTKNCKVLVYGNWPNQSKNIIPFFTASYSEHEIEDVEIRTMIRHPELDSESHGQKSRISNQVENDENNRHSELDTESLGNKEQISNQVGKDQSNRHSERSEAISSDKQITTSHTPRNDENNRHSVLDTEFHQSILKFLFVGGLTPGKQPLLSVKVVHQLLKKGIQAQLNIYGNGIEKNKIERFIVKNNLQNRVFLHGNQSEQIVKAAYKKAHFLLFISKSEGWPKVVAEAMFWGCVPLTSNVSCVNEMIGDGSRGTLVEPDIKEIVNGLESYLNTKGKYKMHAQNAMDWSRQYTLEKFEEEIKPLLTSFP